MSTVAVLQLDGLLLRAMTLWVSQEIEFKAA